MIWLRSTLFHLAFWVWTLTLGVAGVPALLYAPLTRHIAMLWVNGALFLLRSICGLDVVVRGQEHIAAGAAVYAAKHQSTLDTLVLWKQLGAPAFILKKQLLLIPVFGWYLARCEPIAIIRSLGAKMLPHILTQAKAKLAEGRNIVIFPEGTRTKPYAPAVYKLAGVSAIYDSTQVSVIPVALNTGLYWGKRHYCKRAGHAIIEFLPPIAEGLSREEMTKQLPQCIETASTCLLDEVKNA